MGDTRLSAPLPRGRNCAPLAQLLAWKGADVVSPVVKEVPPCSPCDPYGLCRVLRVRSAVGTCQWHKVLSVLLLAYAAGKGRLQIPSPRGPAKLNCDYFSFFPYLFSPS